MIITRILALAAAVLAAPLTMAPPAAANPSNLSISELAAVDLVNGYLNDIRTLQGEFVQVAPDGTRTQGRFFIEKPGKLRFEYARPARTRVVADGFWVAVQDRQLNTTEKYPLRTTPLKLLLAQRVDLLREARVVDIEAGSDLISVTLEESAGEAAGYLTLVFDPVQNELKRWIVTDVQGLDTTVELQSIVAGQAIDPARFRIVEDTTIDVGEGR